MLVDLILILASIVAVGVAIYLDPTIQCKLRQMRAHRNTVKAPLEADEPDIAAVPVKTPALTLRRKKPRHGRKSRGNANPS